MGAVEIRVLDERKDQSVGIVNFSVTQPTTLRGTRDI
jgi:hypothetical protein